jgi:hypothetical protein
MSIADAEDATATGTGASRPLIAWFSVVSSPRVLVLSRCDDDDAGADAADGDVTDFRTAAICADRDSIAMVEPDIADGGCDDAFLSKYCSTSSRSKLEKWAAYSARVSACDTGHTGHHTWPVPTGHVTRCDSSAA